MPLLISIPTKDKVIELDLRKYKIETVDSPDNWSTVKFTLIKI